MRTTNKQSDWRSSQIISKMQKCQHSQTLVTTPIWNILRKWHPGSTVFILTRRKNEITKSKSEPRWQEFHTEDDMTKQYFGQKILMIWLQQIKKSLMRDVNLERISDTQSWDKIPSLNLFNFIRANQKLLRGRQRSLRKFFKPSEKPKVLYTDNSLELRKSCEDLSYNRRTWTPIDPRQMRLRKERNKDKRKGSLLYVRNETWMKNEGLIPWNTIAIHEMSKTSWQIGQHLKKDVPQQHLNVHLFRLT